MPSSPSGSLLGSKAPIKPQPRQGSDRSWKSWKVLEFYCGIFQDFPVLENATKLLVLESSGNLLNSSEKYEMYARL